MANKYSFEMSLDTKGYTDGAKAAEDANADFVSSLGKVNKDLPNLRKELGASKREAQSLALAYQKLSNAEKNSAFGKTLKKQLDECKKKTAELVDLSGDLNQEIKNMASDTAAWDAMKEGLGVGKDAMTALVSMTADLTGNEKELGQMIQKIAQVQSIANTAISVGNALQKQSALMNGVRRVQELALSKAIQLETSSTVGATVAQKAFNLVAKANPYVLLGTAALALVGTLGVYIASMKKTETEEQKLQEEIRKEKIAWQEKEKTVNDSVATNLASYYKLAAQWKTLSDIHQKNKWIEENGSKFKAMGLNIDSARAAEEAFVNNTSAVVAAIKARAEAEAWGQLYQEHMLKKLKDDLNGSVANNRYYKQAKAGDIISDEEAKALGIVNKTYQNITTSAGTYYTQVLPKAITAEEAHRVNIYRNNKAITEQNKELKEGAKILDGMTKAQEDAAKAEANLGNLATANTTATKSVSNNVQATVGSIATLEKQISDLQEKAKNGLLPAHLADPKSYQEELRSLQSQLKELKVKWGFEEPETKLQQLQKQLDAAQKAYVIGVSINDINLQQTALMAYRAVENELEEHKAKIKIEPTIDPKEIKNQLDEINSLVNDTYKANVDFKFDFSSLPEASKKEAEAALEQFNKIRDARQRLNEIIDNKEGKYGQEAIDQAREKVVLLTGSYNELFETLNGFSETNTMFANIQQNVNNTVDTLNSLGQVTSSLGNVFKSVGNDAAAAAMEIISATTNMVSQVVPQIMKLIGAKQAEAMAEGTVQGSKLSWPASLVAIASIVGTILSVFAQIKQAGKFAQGGTVGGSSYYGDKLMAFVNSGETILTKDQTKNAVDAIDNNKLDRQIIVIGETKLKGSDIYIALKNYDGVQSKLGKNIGIR